MAPAIARCVRTCTAPADALTSAWGTKRSSAAAGCSELLHPSCALAAGVRLGSCAHFGCERYYILCAGHSGGGSGNHQPMGVQEAPLFCDMRVLSRFVATSTKRCRQAAFARLYEVHMLPFEALGLVNRQQANRAGVVRGGAAGGRGDRGAPREQLREGPRVAVPAALGATSSAPAAPPIQRKTGRNANL